MIGHGSWVVMVYTRTRTRMARDMAGVPYEYSYGTRTVPEADIPGIARATSTVPYRNVVPYRTVPRHSYVLYVTAYYVLCS